MGAPSIPGWHCSAPSCRVHPFFPLHCFSEFNVIIKPASVSIENEPQLSHSHCKAFISVCFLRIEVKAYLIFCTLLTFTCFL